MSLPATLLAKQSKSLWLSDRPVVKTFAQAKKFMESVGICLRYWPAKNLPLASAYQASMGKDVKEIGQPRAIELTNQLLRSYEVVEVNVIADRICLVHRSLVPALHRLVTRGEDGFSKLSPDARRNYKLIEEKEQVTAGDVRKMLGVKSNPSDDPAYHALAELQRWMLVDRGPFKMPGKGIPDLPKEGYPYHFFREAHPDLQKASIELSVQASADTFILSYLKGAQCCPLKKMGSMFKMFLLPAEIEEAVDRLVARRKLKVEKIGRDILVTIK